MGKRIYRSRRNKVISGVCGGIAEYYNVDPVVVRIIFAVSLLLLHIIAFTAYIVLCVVLPVEPNEGVETDKTVTIQKPPEEKKDQPVSIFASIAAALVLIIAGILFLVPGSVFGVWDITFFAAALILILIGGKAGFDMINENDHSLIKLSLVFITITYGIFIILNRFQIIGAGIYFEYAKNLVPALLILIGIDIIFKKISNKLPAIILGILIFILIGAYSYTRGNCKPGWFFNRIFNEGFNPWTWHGYRLHKRNRWNFMNFSGSYDIPKNISNINFNIRNSGGNLTVGDSGKLAEYNGEGIAPEISTNYNGTSLIVDFASHAANTKLFVSREKISNIELYVSAGNLDGNLENIDIRNLRVSVSGGSTSLRISDKTREAEIEGNAGNTKIGLPRNVQIRIKAEGTFSRIEIPDDFHLINGEYIYNGGEGKMSITASVNMGNLNFHF